MSTGSKSQAVTGVLVGVEGRVCSAQVEVQAGLPALVMPSEVPGRADMRARALSAIHNCGFEVPMGRVVLSLLAGGELVTRLEPWQDLAIAVALLRAGGWCPPEAGADFMFLGEFTLAGGLRAARGVLPMAEAARAAGKVLVVPQENAREAALVPSLRVLAVADLGEVVSMLRGHLEIMAAEPEGFPAVEFQRDMAEVVGNEAGKAAMELAAAGGHGVLLVGSPGCGKTALAQRLTTIMAPPSHEESLEATRVASVAGLLNGQGLAQRPFRAPHHTISDAGLVGGGFKGRPGEVSLAHTGVLFLDEVNEFRRPTLEAMEGPLREGHVSLARKGECVSYPSRALLVAAMSPCPCGMPGRGLRLCSCSKAQVERHWTGAAHFIGARVDIHVELQPFKSDSEGAPALPSAHYRARVVAARMRQHLRFAGTEFTCNAELGPESINTFCSLSVEALAALDRFLGGHGMARTPETVARLKALALTCADLEGHAQVEKEDMQRALSFWAGTTATRRAQVA